MTDMTMTDTINDNQAIALLYGLLSVIIMVKVLKFCIKQKRPDPVARGYGMPSTRAAVITFLTSYLILCNNFTMNTKIIMIVLASIIIYLKYHLREHSLIQLLVGAILGLSMAYICFKILLLCK